MNKASDLSSRLKRTGEIEFKNLNKNAICKIYFTRGRRVTYAQIVFLPPVLRVEKWKANFALLLLPTFVGTAAYFTSSSNFTQNWKQLKFLSRRRCHLLSHSEENIAALQLKSGPALESQQAITQSMTISHSRFIRATAVRRKESFKMITTTRTRKWQYVSNSDDIDGAKRLPSINLSACQVQIKQHHRMRHRTRCSILLLNLGARGLLAAQKCSIGFG